MPWLDKVCAECAQPFSVYRSFADQRQPLYCSRSCAATANNRKRRNRTHCRRGHLLTPENKSPTIIRGVIVSYKCKTCHETLNRARAQANSPRYQSEETMITYLELDLFGGV